MEQKSVLSEEDFRRLLLLATESQASSFEEQRARGILAQSATYHLIDVIADEFMPAATNKLSFHKSVSLAIFLATEIESKEGRKELVLPKDCLGDPEAYGEASERIKVTLGWKRFLEVARKATR